MQIAFELYPAERSQQTLQGRRTTRWGFQAEPVPEDCCSESGTPGVSPMLKGVEHLVKIQQVFISTPKKPTWIRLREIVDDCMFVWMRHKHFVRPIRERCGDERSQNVQPELVVPVHVMELPENCVQQCHVNVKSVHASQYQIALPD